jgi:Domain of unknown function DUF11/Thioester domain
MNQVSPVSTSGRTTLMRRIALLGAAIATVAAPAVASAATPANLLLDTASPEYNLVTIKRAAGGTVQARPSLFNQNITPTGLALYSPSAAFCTDLDHEINEGINYAVNLTDATDDPTLNSAAYQQVTWLIDNAPLLVANSVNKPLEAGAIQVAIWQLVAGASNAPDVTNDTQLNARITAIRALANAGKLVGPITISSPVTTTCSTSTVPLSLKGTPGTTATVAISAGTAKLSAPSVTFDAAGVASVSVSGATPGTVTVTASASGVKLVKAGRINATVTTPQETAHVRPVVYTANTSITFTNCTTPGTPGAPGTPPSTPTTPVVSPTVAEACINTNLKVGVSAPKSVRAGSTIMVALTAQNMGTATADASVLRYKIPSGFSLVSRPAGSRVSNGVVTITLGNLGPNSVRRAKITLRADRSISGGRRHSATVTAKCGANRTGVTTTQVRALPTQCTPAVTG